MHPTVGAQQFLLLAVFLVPAVVGALSLSALKRRAPVLVIGVCAVLAVCFVLQTRFPDLLTLFRRDGTAIAAGEVWRLVTALFFQDAALFGVVFNLAMLLLVGAAAEQMLTRRGWIFIYLAGGFAAELVALSWQPFGAGNSVATASLAGSILVLAPTSPTRVVSLALRLIGFAAAAAIICYHDIHGAALMIGAALALGARLWLPARRVVSRVTL